MEEFLTVAAVARRIGVAPATLRTWARRYGLGPTSHEAGEHRLYSANDLARLTLMRRLIAAGVAPANAAQQALSSNGEVHVEKILENCEIREDVVAAVLSAARSLDRKFMEALLRKDLDKYGVIDSWQEVIAPALVEIGAEWALTGEGIEVEHLLSEIIIQILREKSSSVKNPINGRPVLLASVGEEQHSLALHALVLVWERQAPRPLPIPCCRIIFRNRFEQLFSRFIRPAFIWAAARP